MNKRKRLLALLINGVLLSSLSCIAMAAPDTSIGTGNGVAYGTGSDAPKIENVALVMVLRLSTLMVLVQLQVIS